MLMIDTVYEYYRSREAHHWEQVLMWRIRALNVYEIGRVITRVALDELDQDAFISTSSLIRADVISKSSELVLQYD
ncbi:hypothetical protein DPMN_090371 [Dreissena polymorpha]|uniref:Uncharacterized protein n=1 Tax=Dreissena polymorpha TaxID=45954 RepID=A0A9D4KXL3_DREPO|nr:hypothetical protein DPMN_090371 [Dreissena polymorpha]